MPIFAKYLVVFENKNRDSQVVRVFYKRKSTRRGITPMPQHSPSSEWRLRKYQ